MADYATADELPVYEQPDVSNVQPTPPNQRVATWPALQPDKPLVQKQIATADELPIYTADTPSGLTALGHGIIAGGKGLLQVGNDVMGAVQKGAQQQALAEAGMDPNTDVGPSLSDKYRPQIQASIDAQDKADVDLKVAHPFAYGIGEALPATAAVVMAPEVLPEVSGAGLLTRLGVGAARNAGIGATSGALAPVATGGPSRLENAESGAGTGVLLGGALGTAGKVLQPLQPTLDELGAAVRNNIKNGGSIYDQIPASDVSKASNIATNVKAPISDMIARVPVIGHVFDALRNSDFMAGETGWQRGTKEFIHDLTNNDQLTLGTKTINLPDGWGQKIVDAAKTAPIQGGANSAQPLGRNVGEITPAEQLPKY